MGGVREDALKLIAGLPEETSWDDIICQVYVRKKIEKGIEAAEQGRAVPHEEVLTTLSRVVFSSRILLSQNSALQTVSSCANS